MANNLQKLIDIRTGDISTVLQSHIPIETIEAFKRTSKKKYRDRLYSLPLSIYGMLYQASQDDKSEQHTVFHLSEYFERNRDDYIKKQSELAPSAEKVGSRKRGRPKKLYKRPQKSKLKPVSYNAASYNESKQRVDLSLLDSIFKIKVKELEALSINKNWNGHKVYIADGSTLKTPDTPELREYFDVANTKNPQPLPLTRIECVMGLYGGGIVDFAIGKYGDSESKLIYGMYGKSITSGSVFMGDDLYCSFAHFVLAQLNGIDVIAQGKKLRNEKLIKKISENDSIVEWKNSGEPAWLDKDIVLPTTLQVRKIVVIRPDKPNEKIIIYTTLLDSEKYSAADIVALYFSRWQIELSFRNIKILLQLEYLRSKTVEGVKKEIYSHMILYNILRIYLAKCTDTQETESFFPFGKQIQICITDSAGKDTYVDVRGRSYNRKGGNRTHKSPC